MMIEKVQSLHRLQTVREGLLLINKLKKKIEFGEKG